MTTVEPGASEVFTQGLLSRPRSTAFFASSPAPTITEGFDVFVQLVIAAITTRPWSSSVSVPSSSVTVTGSALRSSTAVPPARRGLPRFAVVVLGRRVGGREALGDGLVVAVPEALGGFGVELRERLQERILRLGERDPVLRALGAGDARLDVAEVELERVGEGGVLGVLVVEHPLLPGVGVDQLDQVRRPAGELQVAERLLVDGEDRAGRAELRRHVPDRGPVGERQGAAGPGRRTPRTSRRRRARAASR